MSDAANAWSASTGSDCEETVRLLFSFIDGELTEEVRVSVTMHLDTCPPCEQVVSFQRELRAVIADRCQERLPDALRERIMAALADEARRHRS